MFPQLIAGPIIRYHDIARQLATANRDAAPVSPRASGASCWGWARRCSSRTRWPSSADKIFALPAAQTDGRLAWLGVVCYTLQIYFDFSGYSDMAIGLGRMFGFRFLENFNYPYISRSITRILAALAHLAVDLVPRLPLHSAGRQPPRAEAGLREPRRSSSSLCGLWHGASWTFVVWGLFHGLFLVVERLGLGRFLASRRSMVQHIYALLIILISWVLFRSNTLTQAAGMLAAMAGFARGTGLEHHLSLYLDARGGDRADCRGRRLHAGVAASRRPPESAGEGRWQLAVRRQFDTFAAVGELALLMLIFLLSLSWMAAGTYSPFLYFRF